jgi:hypothetical protein
MSSDEGMLTPILVGAVLGGAYTLVAPRSRQVSTAGMFAIALVVAALAYVALALIARDPRWLGVETAGAGLFGAVAWLGLRSSLWWLTFGWLAHVAWDVGLHLDRAQSIVGPDYPLLCVGFDLVVAGFLLGMTATRKHTTLSP